MCPSNLFSFCFSGNHEEPSYECVLPLVFALFFFGAPRGTSPAARLQAQPAPAETAEAGDEAALAMADGFGGWVLTAGDGHFGISVSRSS